MGRAASGLATHIMPTARGPSTYTRSTNEDLQSLIVDHFATGGGQQRFEGFKLHRVVDALDAAVVPTNDHLFTRLQSLEHVDRVLGGERLVFGPISNVCVVDERDGIAGSIGQICEILHVGLDPLQTFSFAVPKDRDHNFRQRPIRLAIPALAQIKLFVKRTLIQVR